MKHNIFISHSLKDRDLAETMVKALRKHDVSVFNDTAIKPGNRWRSSITDAIRDSAVVLVLWTPHSKTSDWVNYEVGFASGLGKNVIVLKPSSFSVSDLPVDLAGWRVVDFDPASPDKAAKSLVSELASAA